MKSIAAPVASRNSNVRAANDRLPALAAQGEGMTMKIAYACLLSLLTAAFIAIISGCTTTTEKFGDAPHARMTASQARRALGESLNRVRYFDGWGSTLPATAREVRIKRDRVDWEETAGGQATRKTLVFQEMKDLRTETYSSPAVTIVYGKNASGDFEMMFLDKADATKLVDAVLTLRAAAQGPGSDETDFAAFSERAKVWLATTPRPEMPEEARTYKLLAEDAFKRQDLAATLEAYENALDIYPMWANGHYDAALLAAETGDYSLAADHMRRYLVLSPNAKDARASKDKLLLWQHKAKE